MDENTTVKDFVKKFNLEGGISDTARENLSTPLQTFQQSFGSNTQVAPTIDVENIGQSRFQVPEQPASPTEGIIDTIRSVASSVTPDELRAEQQLRQQEQNLLGLQGDVVRRGQEEATLQEQLGVTGFEQDIFDIASQTQQLRASLSQGLVNEEGRVAPLEVITGRQAQLKRQAAAQLEGLQAAAEAAQNNIFAANSRIERALNRKYGDLSQRIEFAKTALQVNESQYTRAEKRAAQQRQTELSILQNELETKKLYEQNAMKDINAAIVNGYSPAKGAQLMRQVASGEINPFSVYKEIGGSLVDQLRQIQIAVASEELKAKRDEAAIRKQTLQAANDAGVVQLTEEQVKRAGPLIDDYEKESSEFKTVANSYSKIKTSAEDPTAAGDVSLIFAYMKMLDPTSVVREGEQATAANAGSIPQRVIGQYNRALNGQKFSPEIRNDFVNRAGRLYATALEGQKQRDQQYSLRAKQFGVPPEAVIRDLTLGMEVDVEALTNEQFLQLPEQQSTFSAPASEDFYNLINLQR